MTLILLVICFCATFANNLSPSTSKVQINGINVASNDLFAASNIGSMIIRDARGKRIFGENEIICGADFADNKIRTGNGGSKLWGGSYGNDDLNGGAGEEDTINLTATTLDQISGVYVAGGGTESDIMMNFNLLAREFPRLYRRRDESRFFVDDKKCN